MLGLAMGRQARGVGGQKGKRGLGILAVFRQVEVHAADQVPGRVLGLEVFAQGQPGRRAGRVQRCLDLAPQCRQGVRAQVFGAGHGRRVQHQRLQGRRIGRGTQSGQRIALLRGAQGRK
jgi:hypothetical protein